MTTPRKRTGAKFVAPFPNVPDPHLWTTIVGPGGMIYFAHPQHKPLVLDIGTGNLSIVEPEDPKETE